ncbi:MAG: hypothetical protein ABI867_15385 [Kofleriaceae bacterium]
MISVATAADKRTLNQHVADPGADAATTLAAALAEPPTDPEQLAWMLVWAGKVALGPRPTDVSKRTELCAAIDPHHESLARYLAHVDRAVRAAATLPLAACRGNAAAVQAAFATCTPGHYDVASALRIASGVLARASGTPRALESYPVRPGDPTYYADAIGRQLAGEMVHVRELLTGLSIGERRLAKLPWFPSTYPHVVRGLIQERPLDEREALAREQLLAGPLERDTVSLVFVPRMLLPRHVSRADDLAATTYVRGELTEIQRAVLGATTKFGPGLGGSVEWHQHRLPESQLGRDVLHGRAEGPLAAIVDTAHGPTPMFVALVDLLAEAVLEKWKPARHRAALAVLTATADRHALDAAARACPELSAPHALMGLMGTTAPAWP